MGSRTDLVLRTSLIVVTTLVLIGLARLLIQIVDILLIVLIAAILATGVSPLVSNLERMRWGSRGLHISRTWAILIIFILLIVLLVLLTGLLVTPVVLEAQQFLANLPQNLLGLETIVQQWEDR